MIWFFCNRQRVILSQGKYYTFATRLREILSYLVWRIISIGSTLSVVRIHDIHMVYMMSIKFTYVELANFRDNANSQIFDFWSNYGFFNHQNRSKNVRSAISYNLVVILRWNLWYGPRNSWFLCFYTICYRDC